MKQNILNWFLLAKNRVKFLYLASETTAVRIWFGFFSVLLSVYFFFDAGGEIIGSVDIHFLMYRIASPYLWAMAFLAHGISMIYGAVLNKYGTGLLFIEGVLGVAVWSACAASITIAQRAPGGEIIGAFLALWLLVRYPTHHEWEQLEQQDDRFTE